MSEDVTIEGFRLVLNRRDKLLDQVRRFDEALADDPDPVRNAVAAELLELVGLACITCGALCVPGPECETCQDKRAAAEHGHIEKAGVRP